MSERENRHFSGREERKKGRMRRRASNRDRHERRDAEIAAEGRDGHERPFREGHFKDGKEWFGIFIIVVGLVWLAKAFLVTYPAWFFSWQMLVIGIGLAIGLSSHFRKRSAYILILVGLAFIARDYIFPGRDLGPYIWPVLVIAAGVMFLLKKRQEDRFGKFAKEHPEKLKDWRHYWHQEAAHCSGRPSSGEKKPEDDATNTASEASYREDQPQSGAIFEETPAWEGKSSKNQQEWVEVNTFLGATKRNIWSKNIKGGEIVSILGGAEVDMSRADISGNVTLNLTVIMGGVRLAVPPNWKLNFNETCIMGGTEDHRRNLERQESNKTLTITGIILMGGLEVGEVF